MTVPLVLVGALAMAQPKKFNAMTQQALDLLKESRHGLSMPEMREALAATAESQEHFNRRVRDIRKRFALEKFYDQDRGWVYKVGAEKVGAAADLGQVSEKLRAAVIHRAHGRCEMCGRTIRDDGVKLQADHRIPTSWGGVSTLENLWAICEACNRGKRNHFASFEEDDMRSVLEFKNVHERLAQFMRLNLGRPVADYALEFVANLFDRQDDWQKRIRELRYSVIGLKIAVTKKRDGRATRSFYMLTNWKELPPEPTRVIRAYENRNRSRSKKAELPTSDAD
ncbi:MAG: HNH endonuclease [Alphaproteobacteria bacterium]|nr:HNH endonuclease [Alphaproteobacteria bacterium]